MFSALEIFFGNAIYKFTFYLLTYCRKRTAKIFEEEKLWM